MTLDAATTPTLAAVTIWASPAADDWLQSVVNLQQSLAALGISLSGGVTSFGQGMAAVTAAMAFRSVIRPKFCSGLTGVPHGWKPG